MAAPVRIDLGLRETALPTSRPVALRVFRLAITFALPWLGGVSAIAIPIAVVDRGASPPRTRIVFDPAYSLLAAAIVIAAARMLGRGLANGQNRSVAGRKRNGRSSE